MKEVFGGVLALCVAVFLVVFIVWGILNLRASGEDQSQRTIQECAVYDKTIAHVATYNAEDAVTLEKFRSQFCYNVPIK